ncbi:LysR family transcriptional regulator [Pseudescherichia vulneris]
MKALPPMQESQKARFDYNLIRFHVAIVETGSMLNAAEMLNVAPSAVSHAVKKLRGYYSDPLFIKTLHGVKPTTKAMSLYDTFKSMVTLFNQGVNTAPGGKKRRVHIRADHVTEFYITDKLIDDGIVPQECILEYRSQSSDADKWCNNLRAQNVDIDIGPSIINDKNIVSETLFHSNLILVCRQDSSAFGSAISFEQYKASEHVAFSTEFRGGAIFNNMHALYTARTREPMITSDSFITLLTSAIRHDLLMIIPDAFYDRVSHLFPLRKLENHFIPETQIRFMAHIHKNKAEDRLIQKILRSLSSPVT